MLSYVCDPSTPEVEAGRTQVQNCPLFQSKSEVILAIMKLCLQKNK